MTLLPDTADRHGSRIQVETRKGQPSIGCWDDPKDFASWTFTVTQLGTYEVSARLAATTDAATFVVELAGTQLPGKAPMTGGWDEYETVQRGRVVIQKPGECVLTVRPRNPQTWKAMNLMAVSLRKAR